MTNPNEWIAMRVNEELIRQEEKGWRQRALYGEIPSIGAPGTVQAARYRAAIEAVNRTKRAGRKPPPAPEAPRPVSSLAVEEWLTKNMTTKSDESHNGLGVEPLGGLQPTLARNLASNRSGNQRHSLGGVQANVRADGPTKRASLDYHSTHTPSQEPPRGVQVRGGHATVKKAPGPKILRKSQERQRKIEALEEFVHQDREATKAFRQEVSALKQVVAQYIQTLQPAADGADPETNQH
mmetsp:Transcript_117366/g.204392  ORF Transcript_117366/g.204392 Transcript_117366/m.204392 type:complete len:238 (-) Transcript_117366:419-1132(-)